MNTALRIVGFVMLFVVCYMVGFIFGYRVLYPWMKQCDITTNEGIETQLCP